MAGPTGIGELVQPSAAFGVYSSQASVAIDYDAELMLRVREGDTACFAELVDRHRRPVLHFVYRMVQNQAIAEELSQEVFLRVYRSRAKYEASAKFTTWMFRIAAHLALNSIRDRRHDRTHDSLDIEKDGAPVRQLADRKPSVELQLVKDSRLEEVRAAIDALPAKQRAAVLMHKYQEMEYTQIAKALECSESAVKSLLFRAYESLRARLAHFA
jgi:RNA polymerase sigma-70 factor, ECF subfamily